MTPKALRELQKMDKTVASKILDGIEEFASNPVLTKIKKLKTPFEGANRLRIWDYSVVFYKENDLMLISRVAHRKEVYI